jgi:hypothetical protein
VRLSEAPAVSAPYAHVILLHRANTSDIITRILNANADEFSMKPPPLNPSVSDVAPVEPILTGYDEQHLVTYLRLLDADASGADWREGAKLVLQIDPEREPERAKRAWESHLARAKWMTESGYRHLLRGDSLR